MRKFPIFLVLVLAGCGGNGDGVEVALEPVQHVPEISNLTLSPDSALYLEGDGSVQVTAELFFTDVGRDIETLNVKMSNGTTLAFAISGSNDSVSGTLAETFDVTTADVDGCTVEIWLVDKAGQSSNHLSAVLSVIKHTPEILNVNLSPDSIPYMERDGSVAVTAEITFRDAGRDIQTLWIRMPDGTSIDMDLLIATETGAFTKEFMMSTETAGTFVVEFWLLDKAGDSSGHVTADFEVIAPVQISDWTKRLSVPLSLNDVVWDGQVFVAVGDGGAVLTSVDGIDWVARESATDYPLYGIAAFDSDIYAVGGSIVLLSTDHGETWTVKAQPDFIGVEVVANSSQVIVTGIDVGFLPHIMISEDRAETWQSMIFSWGVSDLIYRDGLFVAPALTGVLSGGPVEPCVIVSTDGKQWNEIFVGEEVATLRAIVDADSQVFVAGEDGTVFSSFDALNWTEISTPLEDVDYSGGAWNGTRLILAGRVSSNHDGSYRPIGISSSDGGASWDSFGIDANYESNSMAWGNGRFVSVGQALDPDGGAIYTTE